MVALGRPGAGEDVLTSAGFVDVERIVIPFAWEFADPEAYARALSSTGPAYEAIQAVGEEAFAQAALDRARERLRDGLPLRAPIAVVGYVARKPPPEHADRAGAAAARSADVSFLAEAATSAEVQRLFDDDIEQRGYVMNARACGRNCRRCTTDCSACSGRRCGPAR